MAVDFVEGGAFRWFYVVVGRTGNEGLDKVNAEEAKEVDDGGEEGEDGGDVGEGEEVEGGGGADLVAPAVEEVVGDGEEEGEEEGVGEVEGEGESVGGLGGGGRGSTAEVHGAGREWWRNLRENIFIEKEWNECMNGAKERSVCVNMVIHRD